MAQRTPRIATFDCYGTLVDWEGGLGTFLYEYALRSGEEAPPPGRELRERWEAIQFQLVRGNYRPYRTVLAESLRALAEERGWGYDDAEGAALLRSMMSWQPFPDTQPSLTRARAAGMRLVIVSNTEREIIGHTMRQLEVPFDEVITAEDCGAYKPSPTVFERVLGELGEPPDRVLHVAFGFKYDIGPAQRVGMETAWVNRHREPAPGPERPDHEWRDLSGLAELAEHGR
jgi:2-haloacid dehalogenase